MISSADQFSTWTTGDEIEYLNSIGTNGIFRPERKRELLEGYAAALKYRPKSQKYLDFTKLHEVVYELLNEGSTTH